MFNCIHTKWLGVILGVAFSTIISGCGSSGDAVASRSAAAASSPICAISSGENPICGSFYNNNIRISARAAASDTPSATAGNLFQSSGAADTIELEVIQSRTKLNFEVRRSRSGSMVELTNEDELASEGPSSTVNASVTIRNVLLFEEFTPAGSRPSSTTSRAYVNMIHDYSATLNLSTSVDAPSDSDYMAAGLWVLKATGNNPAYEIGAFAHGNQPFTLGNIDGLESTATYTGDAIGLWTSASSASAGTSSTFDGKVSLTANFGSAIVPGSVSGFVNELSGFTGSSSTLTITLGTATISDAANGGFFNGLTTLGFSADQVLTGTWGGQFFGNGAASTDHPRSTAGTFGGTHGTGANELSYIGAFLGYR